MGWELSCPKQSPLEVGRAALAPCERCLLPPAAHCQRASVCSPRAGFRGRLQPERSCVSSHCKLAFSLALRTCASGHFKAFGRRRHTTTTAVKDHRMSLQRVTLAAVKQKQQPKQLFRAQEATWYSEVCFYQCHHLLWSLMSVLMFYVVIFSPAQPLLISGDVTKCFLEAGKKAKKGGEPGKVTCDMSTATSQSLIMSLPCLQRVLKASR